MKKKQYTLMVFFAAVIILTGCFDNSDCLSDTGSILIVQFQGDTGATAPPINMITIPEGSILYDTAISRYSFPVNPFSDTSTYIFHTDTSQENLQVIFNRNQRLIHPDCGLEQEFIIDTVFTSWSDSLNILQKELLNVNNLNIEIYL